MMLYCFSMFRVLQSPPESFRMLWVSHHHDLSKMFRKMTSIVVFIHVVAVSSEIDVIGYQTSVFCLKFSKLGAGVVVFPIRGMQWSGNREVWLVVVKQCWMAIAAGRIFSMDHLRLLKRKEIEKQVVTKEGAGLVSKSKSVSLDLLQAFGMCSMSI